MNSIAKQSMPMPRSAATYSRDHQVTIAAGPSTRTVRSRIVLSVALFLFACAPVFAQSGTIMPAPKFTALDNNGLPCAGCLLYTYAAGTTSNQATYSDSALTTPNANPVVMDASGRATIFLSATSYKFVLKTGAGATLWTVDNVASIGLSTAAVGSELVVFGGQPNSPVTGTSYPSGTTNDKLHAGTLIWNFNSANVVGTYALEGMLLGNGGTISVSLVNLSDGNPDTPLVTITSSNSTGERQISSAITFAAAGAAKNYGVKVKVSAGYGYAWIIRLVRIS
jgi:hypothetical protein